MAPKPKFVVVTYSLVTIFCASLFLKLIAQYLPERKPNRLSSEYGTYVKTSAREKVDWYRLGEQPFDLARATGKLVLLELGDMFSRDARIHRYNHLEDREYVHLITTQYVPIKVDAFEAPWIRSLVDLNTNLFESSGDFVIVILDPSGRVVDTTRFRPYLSSASQLGMVDYLSETARSRFNREEFASKIAQGERLRQELSRQVLSPSTVTISDLELLASRLQSSYQGGALRVGAFLVSSVPFDVLFLSEALGNLSARELRNEELLALRESPCYDVLRGSFFFKATASNFSQPTYGKLTVTNAQLSAAYARAATLVNAPLFLWTAEEIIEWIIREAVDSESGLFIAGMSTDEFLIPGSPSYDVPISELTDVLSSTFKIDITHGNYGVLRLTRKSDFESAVGASRTNAVRAGVAELQRTLPKSKETIKDNCLYANLNGAIIAALFETAFLTNNQLLKDVVRRAYAQAVNTFVLALGDVLHAPQGIGRTTASCDDYVWLTRAAIQAYRYDQNPSALNDAIRITGRMIELFKHDSGALVSSLLSHTSFLKATLPVCQIADTFTASTNAVAAMNLLDIAAITGDVRYKDMALEILKAFAGAQKEKDIPDAGYVMALASHYAPRILGRNVPDEDLSKLQSKFPQLFCAKTIAPIVNGFYIASGGAMFYGPASYAETLRQLERMGY